MKIKLLQTANDSFGTLNKLFIKKHKINYIGMFTVVISVVWRNF